MTWRRGVSAWWARSGPVAQVVPVVILSVDPVPTGEVGQVLADVRDLRTRDVYTACVGDLHVARAGAVAQLVAVLRSSIRDDQEHCAMLTHRIQQAEQQLARLLPRPKQDNRPDD